MSRFYFRRALIIPSQIVITKAVHFTSSLHLACTCSQPARGVSALFGFVDGVLGSGEDEDDERDGNG